MKRRSLHRFCALPAALFLTTLGLLPTGCAKSAPPPSPAAPAEKGTANRSPASSSESAAAPPASTSTPPPAETGKPIPIHPVPHPPIISPVIKIPKTPTETYESAPKPAPTDDQLIEQSLAQLKKGTLAYNTPQTMKSGSTARVTARIAASNISLQTLEAGMPDDQGTTTQTAATPVSTKMKMTLKGADFAITPLSSEEQIVGGDTPTEWQWDVVPKHAGTLRLHLAAIVELHDLSRDFTAVDRDITVRVDPIGALTSFAAANAVWLLTTLAAGLAGLWAWLKKRRKPKTPNWETP